LAAGRRVTTQYQAVQEAILVAAAMPQNCERIQSTLRALDYF
jgi:hypothetical protein